MKHADFHVGLEFLGNAGFRWCCTDVGTRTVVAIRLDHSAAAWYQGPSYIAKEIVFDEHEMACSHLTADDAIRTALVEADTSHHPGFPHEVVILMPACCASTAADMQARAAAAKESHKSGDNGSKNGSTRNDHGQGNRA